MNLISDLKALVAYCKEDSITIRLTPGTQARLLLACDKSALDKYKKALVSESLYLSDTRLCALVKTLRDSADALEAQINKQE